MPHAFDLSDKHPVCHLSFAGSEGSGAESIKAGGTANSLPSKSTVDATSTIERAKELLRERATMLQSPEYSRDSDVVKQVDNKIRELGNAALGTWTS